MKKRWKSQKVCKLLVLEVQFLVMETKKEKIKFGKATRLTQTKLLRSTYSINQFSQLKIYSLKISLFI